MNRLYTYKHPLPYSFPRGFIIMLYGCPCAIQEHLAVYPCCVCSVQFSPVAQSCPTLCDPMDRSTPGLPVHHQLPEFTQTHAHRVGEAIQPSHPLSSPSPPAFNLSQHQRVFSSESALCIRWPKDWSFSFNQFASASAKAKVGIKLDEKGFLEEGSVPEGCDLVRQR